MIAKTKLGLGCSRAVSKNAFNYDNSAIILVKIIWHAPSGSHAHTDTDIATSRRGVWVCVRVRGCHIFGQCPLPCCAVFLFVNLHTIIVMVVFHLRGASPTHTHTDRWYAHSHRQRQRHTLIEYVWSWCRRRCCVVLAQNLIYTHPKVMQSFGMSIRRRPPSTAPPCRVLLFTSCPCAACTRSSHCPFVLVIRALYPTLFLFLLLYLCLAPAQMTHI